MNSPITLDALKVLDAIERKQNFAGAADELCRVPSAISYTVNKLEEDLGVILFDRSKRKAELTYVGKLIVEQGRLILQATDELTYVAKQSASGWELELRIAIDSIVYFQPLYSLIAELHQQHPWMSIKVIDEAFGGTWEALSAGRCDLIIGAADSVRDNNINTLPIGDIEFIFVVSRDHPLCKIQQPITASMLKQYPSIVVADSSREIMPRSAGILDGQSRITVPNMEQKIEMQLRGVGVGYLPVHRIQNALKTGQLVPLPLVTPETRKHNLCMAWRKENKGKALNWFIEKIQSLPSNLFLCEK
ncbi:LysR family transcriptional regulator [Psychromonas sp.]|nr:LysR family transcriptional regulator [Psychromonas sp.]